MSFAVPQGSTVYLYMDASGFNTPGGVPVNIPDSSGWTYTFNATESPTGEANIFFIDDSLIVQRNDVTLGSKHNVIDFSTTFNATESPTGEANISINHDSLKARPGSKLTYLHNLFVDRGLSAHDETSLANAHTKALDSNFVLLIPPDYSAAAMTFTNRDSALRLINYATINITENDTVPAGASIVIAGKGRFNISSGKTLTFASGSRFDGGLQRRFIGSGTVKFQEDVVEAVHPQWWGAIGDSSTQCVTAFQSAVNSGVKKITVKVPPGAYLFNDKLTIPSNVSLIGDNARIFCSDTNSVNGYIFHVTPSKKNIKIIGFETKYLPEPKVRASSVAAFLINECDTLEIAHCIIRNAPGMGMQLIAVRNAKIHHNHVEYTNADGIHLTNGTNDSTIHRQIRSENVIITDNTVRNNGDDKIAVVSYERPFKAGHDSCEAGHTHKGCPPWGGNGAQLINRNIVIANNIVEGSNDRLLTVVNGTAKTRGITVLGGEKVVIDGNTIKGAASGSTAGSMTRGILISNTPNFWCYRPVDIVVSNNIITDAGAVSDAQDIHAGIGIDGADSVLVVGNRINWSGATAGIRVRGSTQNENFGAGYVNNVKNVLITGNTVQDSKVGLSIFTNSTNLHENITFAGNTISNPRREFVNVDGVKNLYLLNNTCFNVNTENVSNLSAVRIDSVDNDLIIRGNVFRSSATNPTKNAIEVISARAN
ncbi:MAG: right-handed parallel beta-helix repeat-containing protein [bacterium]